MNRKKDPRSKFIIIRTTPTEKQKITEDAMEDGIDVTEFVRAKLGLKNAD